MVYEMKTRKTPSLWSSRRGLAIPVTFLMLFVSLTILISATYYFSISRINAKSQELKAAGVEQEMLSLEKVVRFVAWSPGTYETFEFGDFGGTLKVLPASKALMLNLTDNSSFDEIVFNGSVGKIVYELPPSEAQDNVFLKGDNRAIVNQSSSPLAQVYISQGATRYEMAITYRPSAGSTVTYSSDGRPVNDLRIYIISLNSSESITRMGNLRLKATCVDVTSTWQSYDFSQPISSLWIKADADGTLGSVSLPISSDAQGAVVNLETVVCTIKIEEVGW
jgi:hypothetical protein